MRAAFEKLPRGGVNNENLLNENEHVNRDMNRDARNKTALIAAASRFCSPEFAASSGAITRLAS